MVVSERLKYAFPAVEVISAETEDSLLALSAYGAGGFPGNFSSDDDEDDGIF